MFNTARYAFLLLRVAGIKVFLHHLKRQIYSRDILYGLEKDLNNCDRRILVPFVYTLQRASQLDMHELVSETCSESKNSTHELLSRSWFFQRGFHDCYVGRTSDARRLCFIGWLVSIADSKALKDGFEGRMPCLGEREVLLENCYTFEQFRGKGVMPSAVNELAGIARKRGFQRLITYVRKDNRASLRAFQKLQYERFEEVLEIKLLFMTRRSTIPAGRRVSIQEESECAIR